jgi:hypothetical protein
MRKLPKITTDNYFSSEVRRAYLSTSQVKDFIGVPCKHGCEAAALAKIEGKYKAAKTTSLLVGGYVDAYFEGTLGKFKEENPEIFKKDGSLYSQFNQANNIIQHGISDKMFSKYAAEGDQQVIVTGEIFGQPFCGKIDSLHPGKAIVDLKVMADMSDIYCKDYGYLNFIDAWNYPLQGAIYQELYFQMTGDKLPFFLAVLTKEKQPDKEIIHISNERLEAALLDIETKVEIIQQIKNGEKHIRCEKCDYCKSTKQLTKVKSYNEFFN